MILPSKLVVLGDCVELHWQGGEVYHPKSALLCASLNGKTLWVFACKKSWKKYNGSEVLYSDFTDFEPDKAVKVKVKNPTKAKSTKKIKAVVYRSDKWDGKKREYIHTFKRKPSAQTDNLKNPSFVRIFGAKIRVRPEGITG